jgi:hypothetical protein
VINHEPGDVSYRLGADVWFTPVFGAWTNDHQVGLPLCGSVYDFPLWPTLAAQPFRIGKVARAFIQDIFGGRSLSLSHLFFPGRREAWVPQETLPHGSNIVSSAGIGHKEYAKCRGLNGREHLSRLAYLSGIGAVQTTEYAHSLLLKT